MDKNEYYPIIEGILFAIGEPVEIDKFAYALDMDIKSTELMLCEFMDEYNAKNSGMRVTELDGSFQMLSNPDIFEYLIRVAKKPKKFQLTQSTLEALSIIAYKQPVTKLDIEKIRGVKSDYMVSRLIEYGLVEEVGRSETVGRPILFATTKEFLRLFGLKDIEALKALEVDEPRENDVTKISL